VAIDAAGRAIVIYPHANPEVSDSNTMRQALAPAAGAFAAPSVLDTSTFGENATDTNPRVAANANGAVVAGWGDQCEDDCAEIYYFRMGVGTTSTGVTSSKAVSNPGTVIDADSGEERKAGGISEVAIDEAGNGTMVWDASVAGLATDYDYWSAHSTPAGAIGPSTVFATNTAAIDGELHVAAANGRVLASWTSAPDAGETASVYMAQTVHPGAAAPAWTTPTRVSRSGVSSDAPRVALSSNGVAAISFRRAGDRIAVNTNARKDTSKPTLQVPATGTRLTSSTKVFGVSIKCPSSEARCVGVMTARTGSTVVGRGTFDLDGNERARRSLTLTNAAFARLKAAGSLSVRVEFIAYDGGRNTRTTSRTFTLRRPA